MLESLKEQVYEANMLLPKYGLVVFTWGNVSGLDKGEGIFCIKPSGVPYEDLRPEHMVLLDMQGRQVEGDMRPSSDTATHMALYQSFPELGGVVHTHSRWATIWAQAGRDIPAYGTTHADYIYGPVPCARELTDDEINGAYELETGNVIVERFRQDGLNPLHVPAVLVKSHGPFTFGKDAFNAVHNAVVLEEVAMMAWHTECLPGAQNKPAAKQTLLDKHFSRKHGKNAYYGQK